MNLTIMAVIVILAYLLTHALIRLDQGPRRGEIRRVQLNEINNKLLIEALRKGDE